MIKNAFAAAGFLVFVFCVCGQFGIGHFRLYYGQHPEQCNGASHD